MGRVPQGLRPKGSQRWLQWFVNHAPRTLNEAIGLGPIAWRSPLRDDDYAEYRDEAFLARVGVTPARRSLDSFWPRGGPQWDALGRTRDGAVVLVEGKAHLNELYSPATMASESSLPLIRASLAEAAAALRVAPGYDWSKQFYQYANRLAHAWWLDQLNAIPTKMVFVYFIGDGDVNGPGTRAQWDEAISVVHHALGLARVPPFIVDAFVDVTLSGAP